MRYNAPTIPWYNDLRSELTGNACRHALNRGSCPPGEMDGWEAIQLIKADPATSAIPIVALTAHALASDRDKSVEVGCSDFVRSRSICNGCWVRFGRVCLARIRRAPSPDAPIAEGSLNVRAS
jgi:hypothetical protein